MWLLPSLPSSGNCIRVVCRGLPNKTLILIINHITRYWKQQMLYLIRSSCVSVHKSYLRRIKRCRQAKSNRKGEFMRWTTCTSSWNLFSGVPVRRAFNPSAIVLFIMPERPGNILYFTLTRKYNILYVMLYRSNTKRHLCTCTCVFLWWWWLVQSVLRQILILENN